jgi:hypothetical protein
MNTINKVLCYGMACLSLASTSALAATDGVWSSSSSGTSEGTFDLSFTSEEQIVINGFSDGSFTANGTDETFNSNLCVWTNALDATDPVNFTDYTVTISQQDSDATSVTTPVLKGANGASVFYLDLTMTLETATPGNITGTGSAYNIGDVVTSASDAVNFGATYSAGGAGPTCATSNYTMQISSTLAAAEKTSAVAGVSYSNTFTVKVDLI